MAESLTLGVKGISFKLKVTLYDSKLDYESEYVKSHNLCVTLGVKELKVGTTLLKESRFNCWNERVNS